jgi:hypothetical protein
VNRLLTVLLFCIAGVAWVFILNKAVIAVRQTEFRRWSVSTSPTDETSTVPVEADEPAEKLKKGEKQSKKDYLSRSSRYRPVHKFASRQN